MQSGEFLERNLSVDELISSAPKTLRRVDVPSVLSVPLAQIEGLDRYVTVSASQRAVLAGLQERSDDNFIVPVTAKDVLTIALETPKPHFDVHGSWFTGLPGQLVYFLSELKYGRQLTHSDWLSSGGDADDSQAFRWHTEPWVNRIMEFASDVRVHRDRWGGSLTEFGVGVRLWEFGIIAEQDDRAVCISLGVPWDETQKPWYKRLTPEKLFVGREAELNVGAMVIFGRTWEDLKLDSLLKTTDIDTWWTLASMKNRIVQGSFQEVWDQTRPDFSERIIARLKPPLHHKEPALLVRNSTSMWGYIITADVNQEDVPDLQLHLSDNWLVRDRKF